MNLLQEQGCSIFVVRDFSFLFHTDFHVHQVFVWDILMSLFEVVGDFLAIFQDNMDTIVCFHFTQNVIEDLV